MSATRQLVYWRLALGRWWALSRHRRSVVALVGLVLALTVASVGLKAWQAYERHGALLQRLAAQSQATTQTTQAPRGAADAPPQDFTANLPREFEVPAVIEFAEREARQAGVSLRSLQTRERPPASDALGKAELVFTLRGEHVRARAVIDALLDRYAHMTLSTLRMAPHPGDGTTEIVATVSLWSRPLPAPPQPEPR